MPPRNAMAHKTSALLRKTVAGLHLYQIYHLLAFRRIFF